MSSGQGFLILLDELGFIFRRLQLIPTAPYPSPNGFSVAQEQEWISTPTSMTHETSVNDTSLRYLKEIIRDATDWGYLIEMPHRSKAFSLKTRTKYYINAMFAPYYDLSARHLKEPLYVEVQELAELTSTVPDVRSQRRRTIVGRNRTLKAMQDHENNLGLL